MELPMFLNELEGDYCNFCKTYILNNDTEFIFIDLEDHKCEIQIKDIPPFLTKNSNYYLLAGAISFIPPLIENGLTHYVAFCRNINGSWCKIGRAHV